MKQTAIIVHHKLENVAKSKIKINEKKVSMKLQLLAREGSKKKLAEKAHENVGKC